MSKSADPKVQRQNQPAALKLLSATRLINLNLFHRLTLWSVAP